MAGLKVPVLLLVCA